MTITDAMIEQVARRMCVAEELDPDAQDDGIANWKMFRVSARVAVVSHIALAEIMPPDRATPRRSVYVASKAKYGGEWVAKREAGYPISSTWIDQFESGATSDWPALWAACINEARSSTALVLVCRPGDVLKGAWAEVGAALAANVPVYASGIEDFSIRHHPGVFVCANEDEAFIAAYAATFSPGATALRAKAGDAGE